MPPDRNIYNFSFAFGIFKILLIFCKPFKYISLTFVAVSKFWKFLNRKRPNICW